MSQFKPEVKKVLTKLYPYLRMGSYVVMPITYAFLHYFFPSIVGIELVIITAAALAANAVLLLKYKHDFAVYYSAPQFFVDIAAVCGSYYFLNMKANPLIVFYVMIMLLIFQNRKLRDFVKYSVVVIASFFIISFLIYTFKPGLSGMEWFLLNTSILGAGFLICLIFLRDLNRHDAVINSMYKRNLVLRRRLRIRNEALVAELVKINDKLSRTFLNIISALAKILEARDGYTKGHSEHVTGYALKMGEAINLDRRMMEDIKDGGLAHDIGKVGIPDRILLKPDKLTNSEYGIMKRHVDIGYDILSSIDGMSKTISNISRSHHERVDGRGYPNGLPAEKLPVEVRIMAIADAYDAMTSNRCYRNAMPVEKAVSQLVENSGRQFDGDLAGIFIELIRQGKI
jgi:hypothetical protein